MNPNPPHTPGKMIIISAPSGSGKTTLVTRLIAEFPQLSFSVSATSRAPRGNEKHGTEYYFMSHAEFEQAVTHGQFVEWEEVYPGTAYGTLRSELDRIREQGQTVVFDVDVKGGLRLKKIFGTRALSIFIMPPSVDELRLRLVARGTDDPSTIEKRIAKAEHEIAFSRRFDRIVVNDNLDAAYAELRSVVRTFIES